MKIYKVFTVQTHAPTTYRSRYNVKCFIFTDKFKALEFAYEEAVELNRIYNNEDESESNDGDDESNEDVSESNEDSAKLINNQTKKKSSKLKHSQTGTYEWPEMEKTEIKVLTIEDEFDT